MVFRELRRDFHVAEDYFPREVARRHLLEILELGADSHRGFHHPWLKPNRFHEKPRYPVERYMGLGLYWNPLDYRYHPLIPAVGVTPWPIPSWLTAECQAVLAETFPHHVGEWRAEAALVNYYTEGRKMGRHVDKEEANHRAPVIGFNFGGTTRFYYQDVGGEEQSLLLPGNSVYVFGDSARLMRHGVGAAYKQSLSWESAGLLQAGERLNLTIRQVSA